MEIPDVEIILHALQQCTCLPLIVDHYGCWFLFYLINDLCLQGEICIACFSKDWTSHTLWRKRYTSESNGTISKQQFLFYLLCHGGRLRITSILVYGSGERGFPLSDPTFLLLPWHRVRAPPPLLQPTVEKTYIHLLLNCTLVVYSLCQLLEGNIYSLAAL